MVKEQTNDVDKAHRLSLRRVFLRFCYAAQCLPESWFTKYKDIELPHDPYDNGAFGWLYHITTSRGCLAIKTLPRFEKHDTMKEKKRNAEAGYIVAHSWIALTWYSMQRFLFEAALWSCIRHDNILQFIGMHKDRKGIHTVSNWMEYGTVTRCMDTLVQDGILVPRLRWVSLTEASRAIRSYSYQIHEVACGLQYLHEEGITHGDLHAVRLQYYCYTEARTDVNPTWLAPQSYSTI